MMASKKARVTAQPSEDAWSVSAAKATTLSKHKSQQLELAGLIIREHCVLGLAEEMGYGNFPVFLSFGLIFTYA